MAFPSLARVLSAAKKAGAKIKDLTPETIRDRFTGEKIDNRNTLHRHYIVSKGNTHIHVHTQAGFPDESKAVCALIVQNSPSTDVMTDYFADRFFDTIKEFKQALIDEVDIH
jgi:hypothetical protein